MVGRLALLPRLAGDHVQQLDERREGHGGVDVALGQVLAAALGDHPTLTGKTIELFSRLHKRGFLASVPADQAGRAALKLLAERTPLVRRLHYRRWCFAFGDLHDPTSALRVRLGPIE